MNNFMGGFLKRIRELERRERALMKALEEWRAWAERNGLGSGDERLIAALDRIQQDRAR